MSTLSPRGYTVGKIGTARDLLALRFVERCETVDSVLFMPAYLINSDWDWGV